MHAETGRRRLAPFFLLLLLGAVWLASRTAHAQSTPDAALEIAAAALARDGYVATFAVSGGTSLISGEVRFQSPLAYSLLITDNRGTDFEYIILDTDLYSRDRDPDTGAWNGWQLRPWHPDVPIQAVIAYHPRLPLEMLRAALNVQDEGSVLEDGTTLRRITGDTRYYAALIASHEDQPSMLEQQQRLVAIRWSFTALLDPATATLRRLTVDIPPDEEAGAPAETLTYEFPDLPAPLTLSAPEDVERLNLETPYPEAPATPARSLPVTFTGGGMNVATPIFTSASGSFTVEVDPGISNMQYTLLRVKRGRLLLATIGSITGPGGKVTLPMTVAPGDYILIFAFPRVNDEVTVTVTETRAGAPQP